MRRIGCLLTLVVCLAFWALVAFVAINVFAASREAQDPGSAGPTSSMPVSPEQARTEALGAMVKAEIGSVLRGGEASYYGDGPGLYGAVHSYRWGDPTYPAVVCRADDATRCVTVTVRDHMAHPTRAIDLSPEAFEQLAPLSDGVVQVTVEYGGPSPTLPETSTEVEP